jgi:hypothetical protein
LKIDRPPLVCPECGVLMSFVRERTEVTTDGMRIFLWDYWCTQHGLWEYNPDMKDLGRKEPRT